MKKFFIFLASCVLAICFFGCDSNYTNYTKSQEAKKAKEKEEVVNDVIKNIIYLKDKRTNICFAYYRKNGGAIYPALTTVPCEKIPENLLK